MRNWKFIIRGFAIASAITTFTACEDSQPPRRPSTVTAPVTTPAPEVKPEIKAESRPTPPPVATVKPETKPVAVNDNTDEDDDSPADLVKSAREALDQGEIDRALRLAKLAAKKQPKRAAAWNTLGRAQLKKGERKNAIESFGEAVELNPSSSYAQNNLGLALIYDGKFEEAIAALEEATQLEPVEGYMWNNLGMAYEHLDRLAEARDAYRQAFELDAEHARENLARLEGVKSIRTAKLDTVKTDETIKSTPLEELPLVDGGTK
jgi:tetratricopeptide (TPR) repeat protein